MAKAGCACCACSTPPSVRWLRAGLPRFRRTGDEEADGSSQFDMEKNYFVHESSYVDEPCEIGEGTKIWHFSHVMAGAHIGRRCNIGQNVVISPDVAHRRQREDSKQRLGLHRRRAGRRCVLRAVDGVHERDQPAQPRVAQRRVPQDARQARRDNRR